MNKIKILGTIILVVLPFLKVFATGLKKYECPPANSMVQFYKWYSKNKKQIHVPYPIDEYPGDTTKFYELNHKKLDLYLNKFKSSNLISPIFISDIRQKFESADKLLKARPQNDGPIDDLEVDVIYQTLEEDDITKHLDEMRTLHCRIKGNQSVVLLGIGDKMRFRGYLSKINNKWIIDHITNYSLPCNFKKHK